MILRKITLDDWQGIYDVEKDTIITQGHSINYSKVIEYLGHTIEPIFIEGDDLDEFGNQLPKSLKEIEDYIERKY